VQITRRTVLLDSHGVESWEVRENDKLYWVTLRRSQSGPAWTASVYVEPRSDQKPYWRPLKNWQRLAGEVRAFENQR
jgi:hypothetical protein